MPNNASIAADEVEYPVQALVTADSSMDIKYEVFDASTDATVDVERKRDGPTSVRIKEEPVDPTTEDRMDVPFFVEVKGEPVDASTAETNSYAFENDKFVDAASIKAERDLNEVGMDDGREEKAVEQNDLDPLRNDGDVPDSGTSGPADARSTVKPVTPLVVAGAMPRKCSTARENPNVAATPTKGLHPCDLCPAMFFRESNRDKHRQSHDQKGTARSYQHPDPVAVDSKPYTCDFCDATFKKICNLHAHKRDRVCLEPLVCNVCDKSFTCRRNLRLHVRAHTGDLPFACSVCKRGFSYRSNLLSHERTHTGDRPFHCQVCDRRFSKSNNLSAHMRMHTGEKLFNCEVCNKSFTCSTNLNVHKVTHMGKGSSNYSD